jgi:hypothetical protein
LKGRDFITLHTELRFEGAGLHNSPHRASF